MMLASIGDRLKYVNMADINSDGRRGRGLRVPAELVGAGNGPGKDTANDAACRPANGGLTNADRLLTYVELLFFAYRDFTSDPDTILQELGFGRAHHRVLHFVRRYPGLRIAELLQILKITKQSLGRVLRKLVADGWIEQVPGADDRRERRLTLTAKGRALAAELAALQTRRIDAALREIEASGAALPREHVRNFLFAMITRNERAAVADIVGEPSATANVPKVRA